jgi:hypothetical protein
VKINYAIILPTYNDNGFSINNFAAEKTNFEFIQDENIGQYRNQRIELNLDRLCIYRLQDTKFFHEEKPYLE